MNMNKPSDETLKQGRNRSWLLVKFANSEDEILFSMHTIFRIDEIKYLADRFWEVHLTLTSDGDQQLRHLTQTMEKEIEGGLGWHRLGKLMIRLAEYDKAEQIYKALLDCTPDTDLNDISIYYIQLGYINDGKENLSISLDYYHKALRIQEQFLAPNDLRLATTYNNIGGLHRSMGDYPNALLLMQRAREIRKQSLPPNDLQLASIYNNMGEIY